MRGGWVGFDMVQRDLYSIMDWGACRLVWEKRAANKAYEKFGEDGLPNGKRGGFRWKEREKTVHEPAGSGEHGSR